MVWSPTLHSSILYMLYILPVLRMPEPLLKNLSPHDLLSPQILLGAMGEGNGTPLQYSCLENPMGGGAWWAAVHGVATSWT